MIKFFRFKRIPENVNLYMENLPVIGQIYQGALQEY